MRAVRVVRFGEPEDLVVTEVPVAAAGPGEVLIEVHACGVNFPDLLVARGEYQILAPLPFSPGKEVAGIVRSLGEGVTSLAPGQRVAAQMENGGYAEQVVVSAGITPGTASRPSPSTGRRSSTRSAARPARS
ncbi:MAG: alcohol dehydrogenase catalytic domain-containing protein [Burkholderiales bacterium]|nr:alcohol dehydrogenase catalytic domain-containing protein [Burkholderiales bacterium]